MNRSLAFGVSILFFSLGTTASADNVFHWKDAEGRDHYGSKPPSTAQSVQGLSGKSFSRYSSDKLLRPYRGMAIDEAEVRSKLGSPPQALPEPGLAKVPSDSISEESLMPELVQGDLYVKHDDQKRVVECSVIVKNTAAIPANNVFVNFEFQDGTLVPASGPDSIDADSSGKYEIGKNMLPVTVNGVLKEGPGPKPKVSIRAGAG